MKLLLKMPGEVEIIEHQHSGKNGGHQKSVGGSRKLLQLFRLKPLRWRSKHSGVEKKKKKSPDERRDQLDRDMKNNWEQLPATLRRRKEKLSQAVLDQFTEDVTPAEDVIRPDHASDSDKQSRVVPSDDSIHPASLEGLQQPANKRSEELVVPEQDSVSVESPTISSTSSQIIVRPQIHREYNESSLENVENADENSYGEDLNGELSNDDYLVPPRNLEAGTEREIEVAAGTDVKIQTEASDDKNNNTETHWPAQSETQLKEKLAKQLELEDMTPETELAAAYSKECVFKNNSHEESVANTFLTPEEKDIVSILSKSNCINLNENSDDNSDMMSETSDSKKEYDSEEIYSKSKTEFKKLFLPNESYLYKSPHSNKNNSIHCDETPVSPINLNSPAETEVNQEAPRASSPLSHEEQQVMALLSRAVSEDSLLIPSSPSSTSASSISSSVDERNHDSGTDVNSPSPSTSSSNIESVSTSTSVKDITSHYKNPKTVLKSVENIDDDNKINPDEIIQDSAASQDLGNATDSGIEKSLAPQSTGSSSLSPVSKNNGKSSKISKHNENTPPKSPIDNVSKTKSQSSSSSSSSSSCCFSSLPDDPELYEVVIPRAEYHKPSHIALKSTEYQVPKDRLHRCSATSLTKDKLACDDRCKTRNQPAKSVKMDSLGRDEEDVMSYYDAVVQEGQISNIKDCDDNVDAYGNCSMHPKSKKAVMDGKEYEYVAKGLYINDFVHVEMKNQKSVSSGRSDNGHVGTGNAFAKRYAAMEFVSGYAKPADQSAATSIDLNTGKTFTKGCFGCNDKMCGDNVRWLPDIYGSKWKRPFGLETLNKKPVTMATIMEERECEVDTSATAANTSDSEKLSVREILRRFEELGGRVQLPTDISQVEGDSDAEKSATLREIQETLRCLEEKVRHYETKAATTQTTQDSDENSSGEKVEHSEKLQQKAAPRIPDGLAPSKIALDSWTGHSRSAGHQQQPPSHQQSAVLQSHTNTTLTQQHHQQHHQQRSVITSSPQPPEPPGRQDGKHSLLQFAMLHFRQSPEKFEMLKTADGSISGSLKVIESLKTNKKNKGKKGNKENDWTWKEQVDLVKFSSVPIEQSLLRLEPGELSELAVECFAAVMRYMGDLPMVPDSTEVKCVYTILMHCHKHEALRDEVYCQLMKQTTNNKSVKPDSCQRGWRLFSIVAAYFVCSDTLKPYLFKYLETAAYDKRRAYHGTATVCLHNLRKTFKYGGRKNVPSVEEITAISAGRNSKRQIYRLPGGTERVVNTKSTTVVQDVIEELCTVIGVSGGEMEMEEFSLYCIVEGDTFTMPLAREEYILDVTTELHKNQQVFYLIFCRSVWHFPLRLDSQLYVEVVFNQIAPDYLEGLLLVMPGEQLDQDVIYDIAKMATLLHRAADMTHVPTMKETKFLLPKPALTVRDVKPAQWVNMVQSNWRDVEMLTTIQSKAQVLDILSKWPLFGSSFFAVKRVSDPKERSDHILALNRHGVHFIDLVTHETLTHYTFSEVISTRKVKSEDGTLFLDMKCGNLMQQRITRLQTDQAHEISRLIRQYITMEQRLQQRSAA